MLWAISPAQVNISNYRKWQLQSYVIISQLSLQLFYIVLPLLKYCQSNLQEFPCLLLTILKSNIYQVVFLFFALTQSGAGKRKTTAELTQALTTPASYKHPSQRILQRCIAMRLARPTIAFLPLPVLCNSRLYI